MGKLELGCHLVENCHFDSGDEKLRRFIDTPFCRLQNLHQRLADQLSQVLPTKVNEDQAFFIILKNSLSTLEKCSTFYASHINVWNKLST